MKDKMVTAKADFRELLKVWILLVKWRWATLQIEFFPISSGEQIFVVQDAQNCPRVGSCFEGRRSDTQEGSALLATGLHQERTAGYAHGVARGTGKTRRPAASNCDGAFEAG